ncbi:MAG: hypothetical protein MUC36_01195 [Planctomycetes bacterium]|jgi:hypothetical protein|nr:hypothetical protein [Planctomycetota bacterium]
MNTTNLACALVLWCSPLLAQVANDECVGAIPVGNGVFGPFDNFGATTSAPAWPIPASQDVWFSYSAGTTGLLTVDTCGSGLDTVIQVFDGYCGALTSLGFNDDGCPSGAGSRVTVSVAPGPCWIRVGGFGTGPASSGSFNLAVSGPLGFGAMATNTMLGRGCGDVDASVYEPYLAAGFDLNNTTLRWQPGAGNYRFEVIAGANIVPPTAAATTVAGSPTNQQQFVLPTPLPTPFGPVTTLNVTTFGQLELGTAALPAASDQPSPAALLAWPRAVFACWHDWNPALPGSGPVTFEVLGGVAYATWNGVMPLQPLAWAPSTFQFQLDLATGEVRLVLASLALSTHPGMVPLVVGFSPAGPDADPGATDLSAWTGSLQLGPDRPGLVLVAANRPVVGTTWSLQANQLPASGVLGVQVFGLGDPGFDDLTALGLPRCGLRATLDAVVSWPASGPTQAASLPIPNTLTILGLDVFTTAALWTVPAENPFGAFTTNGLRGRVGSF